MNEKNFGLAEMRMLKLHKKETSTDMNEKEC